MASNSKIIFDLTKTLRNKQGKDFLLQAKASLPTKGITAIFGHSGSGKTTLLRCLAGLERAEGYLTVKGHTWQDKELFVSTHKRPIGYVFQDSRLFPHLNTLENLNYAIKRSSKIANPIQLEHVLNILGVEHLLKNRTSTLSGGEKQRVAIARALLIQPELLLMDEPLASLDNLRKQEIIPYIQKLDSEFGIPILYVTHSVSELAKLADYALLMDKGSINTQGVVSQVFSQLKSANFLGDDTGVILKGKVNKRDKQWGLVAVEIEGATLWVHDKGLDAGSDLRIRILARDVSISLSSNNQSSILNRIPATVEQIEDASDNAMSMVRLRCGDHHIIARITRKSAHDLKLRSGSNVWAQIKSVAILD